jgi:hypothetical protein
METQQDTISHEVVRYVIATIFLMFLALANVGYP